MLLFPVRGRPKLTAGPAPRLMAMPTRMRTMMVMTLMDANQNSADENKAAESRNGR